LHNKLELGAHARTLAALSSRSSGRAGLLNLMVKRIGISNLRADKQPYQKVVGSIWCPSSLLICDEIPFALIDGDLMTAFHFLLFHES